MGIFINFIVDFLGKSEGLIVIWKLVIWCIEQRNEGFVEIKGSSYNETFIFVKKINALEQSDKFIALTHRC